MRSLRARALIALAAAAAVIALPAAGRAFHGQADFARRAIEGGGDGMYFTGSPRWRGYDCTICHENAPGRIRMTLATDPPGLVGGGTYAPGTTYRFTVRMTGEHRGLGSMLNPNTFAMEILDTEAAPAGLFAGLGPRVERPPGEELVVARGEEENATEWSFEWDAPPEDTGPLTAYVAGVDGNGAGDRLGRTGDPFDDDVFVGTLRLQEEGNPSPPPAAADGGCAAAGGGAGLAAPWVLAMLVLAARRRRHGLLVLLLGLSGCHDPDVPVADCERGICAAPRDSGSDTPDGAPPPPDDGGPGEDGAPPPPPTDSGTDAFVPPTDGCTPSWSCTTWRTACDGSDDATRTCTDRNGCGTDAGKPAESRRLAALDENFYRCRVQPIFDRSCSQLACHGDDDRPLRTYSRLKWRIDPMIRGTHNFDGARALTGEEWCRNHDSARGFATGDPDRSELLTQPLAPTMGGLAHAGFTLFDSATDPDYRTIREWLDGASLGSCDAGFND